MKLRRFLEGDWKDVWLPPPVELLVGCVMLVLSASFWTSPDPGAIWDVREWHNFGAILGAWLVYRAWRRHLDPG